MSDTPRDDDDDARRRTPADAHPADDPDGVAPTVLGDVLSSTLDRMHDDRDRESRPTHNPLQAIVGSVLTRLATAQRQQQATGDESPAPPKPAAERPVPAAFDVQALVDEAVRAFALTRLDADGAPETHHRIVVDGEYVARHGTELVPAILAHVAQAWVAVLNGATPPAPPRASSEVEVDIEYDFSDIVRSLAKRRP